MYVYNLCVCTCRQLYANEIVPYILHRLGLPYTRNMMRSGDQPEKGVP